MLAAQTPAGKAPAPKPAAPSARTAKPATGSPAAAPAKQPATTASAKPAAAQQPGKVVVTIGNQTITDKEFQSVIDSLPDNMKAQAGGPMKRQFAEQLVRMKLLAQEARNRGLDKDAAFKTRMAFQEENMLAAALYADIQAKANPDDAALRKLMADNKAEFETSTASHILIRFKGSPVPLKEGQKDLTEEEALAKAQELYKKLNAGEDFAKLAKENSDDTGSGANGGELGTFKHGQMVPAFEKAAFEQPVGKVGEPFKTQFGYHIVKVTKRSGDDFAALKPELEKRARPEAARQAIEDMRKNANVVFDDAYFGPPPAAPDAPGTSGGSAAPPPPPVKH